MTDGHTARNRSRRRKLAILGWLAAAVIIGSLFWNQGTVYKNASRKLGPTPVTDTQRLSFVVKKSGAKIRCRFRVDLQEGLAHIRLIAPDDRIVVDTSGGKFTLTGPKEDERFAAGQYMIEVRCEQAVGTWNIAVYDKSYSSSLNSSTLLTGKLMALVGILAIWVWRWRSHVPWKYFLIGAVIWAVGVALKFAWALGLNEPIIGAIRGVMPSGAALVTSAIYIGLLTGVFEIGVTVVAAKQWSSLARDAGRGLAVGIGAGAVEAVVLGVICSLSAVLKPEAVATSSLSVVPATERLLALLCHASSRAMVLFAVATRRWRWAWGGFFLLTGVDVVAGAFLLFKERTALNPWILELALMPLALISILVLVILVRRWPEGRVQRGKSRDTIAIS